MQSENSSSGQSFSTVMAALIMILAWVIRRIVSPRLAKYRWRKEQEKAKDILPRLADGTVVTAKMAREARRI